MLLICCWMAVMVFLTDAQSGNQRRGQQRKIQRLGVCENFQRSFAAGTFKPTHREGTAIANTIKPLYAMTTEEMGVLLGNPRYVEVLTSCFENLNKCKSNEAINLICRVKRLGRSGSCNGCTPEQQAKIHSNIYIFITKFRKQYPKHFLRVLPSIPQLLS